MNRKNHEINQIKSLFSQFHTLREKCVLLARQLGTRFENQSELRRFQKSIKLRIDIQDIEGLVNIKDELIQTLIYLDNLHREMGFEKTKIELRQKQLLPVPSSSFNQHKQRITSGYPEQAKYTQRSSNTVDIVPNQKPFKQPRPSYIFKPKSRQILLYRPKPDTSENKIDRIAKFVASLKKDMRINAEFPHMNRLKEFMNQEPVYMRMREQLERYQLRQQELQLKIDKIIKSNIQRYFDSCEVVETKDDYRIIKLPKAILNGQRVNLPSQIEPSEQITHQVQADFQEIKNQLQAKYNHLKEVLEKISDDMTKGTQMLNQIREKRKKLFETDNDILNMLNMV